MAAPEPTTSRDVKATSFGRGGTEMKEPFYVRPEDYRYCLRSNKEYGWATGLTEDGLLVLRPRLPSCWLIFDREGNLLRVTDKLVSFREAPIGVKRFWFTDRWLGIEDLPEELSE